MYHLAARLNFDSSGLTRILPYEATHNEIVRYTSNALSGFNVFRFKHKKNARGKTLVNKQKIFGDGCT